MGRTGRSAGAGRFVPRGDDGGFIDARLVMLEWMSDRRLQGWEIRVADQICGHSILYMNLNPPPLSMNHLSHEMIP